MAQTIQIKRSSSSNAPSTSLAAGELAYAATGSVNRLFIGHPDGSTGNIVIGGKEYVDTINAATDANTASTIVKRDASGNFSAGTITATFSGNITGDLTGNADTATALETARTIGGVSFDGTANIDLPGVNIAGTQDTSGNAATATALETGRTISISGDLSYTSPSFDGTGNVTATGTLATVNSNTGSFGSATAIPVITVNGKGLVTAVSTANVATSISILDDSAATVGVDLLTENLTIAGGTLITTVGTDASQTLTINHDSVSRTDSTSTASPSYGSTFTAVDSVTTSTEGHVTAVNVKTVTLPVHTAGTGVTISGAQISIGQDVATTADVDFNDVTLAGTLYGPSTFTIDPAAHGDETGTVVIAGNLTVQGTTTTINSNTVSVGDSILLLNGDETGSATQNAGIEVERGTNNNVQLIFNETTNTWTMSTPNGSDVVTASNILSAANFETNITTIDGGTF